ncbi:MAG: YraN family protein [Planctomycetia bacterium]|nr:YraN family protein [Planctomycetia bacterium]
MRGRTAPRPSAPAPDAPPDPAPDAPSDRGADADRRGRLGARAAVAHLRREGYRILARRLRPAGPPAGGAGEVDVLALDGETLVLVEVKATAGAPAAAFDRVDRRKRRRLRGAWAALARSPRWAARPRRLDVVVVGFGGRRPACVLHRGFAPLSR